MTTENHGTADKPSTLFQIFRRLLDSAAETSDAFYLADEANASACEGHNGRQMLLDELVDAREEESLAMLALIGFVSLHAKELSLEVARRTDDPHRRTQEEPCRDGRLIGGPKA